MKTKCASLLRRAVGWLFRHPVRHFVILWLALLHGGGVYVEVPTLDPDHYSRWASDLRVTPHWRYGFVTGYHGSVLCKARNVPEAVPSPPVDDRDPFEKDLAADNGNPADEKGSLDESLTKAMMRKLGEFPRKAWFEALFFAGLVGFAFWLGPWLWRRLAVLSSQLAWIACLAALLWMIGWTLALLPTLSFGYGGPLSGTYFGAGGSLSADTISYRVVLISISVFPLLFAETTGLETWIPEITAPCLWVVGLIFWGSVGAIVGLGRWACIRGTLRRQASLNVTDPHATERSDDEPHKERV